MLKIKHYKIYPLKNELICLNKNLRIKIKSIQRVSFFEWHNILTGSCEYGRKSFIESNGIDIENDSFTIQEFINLTKNSYGSEIIKKLEENGL